MKGYDKLVRECPFFLYKDALDSYKAISVFTSAKLDSIFYFSKGCNFSIYRKISEFDELKNILKEELLKDPNYPNRFFEELAKLNREIVKVTASHPVKNIDLVSQLKTVKGFLKKYWDYYLVCAYIVNSFDDEVFSKYPDYSKIAIEYKSRSYWIDLWDFVVDNVSKFTDFDKRNIDLMFIEEVTNVLLGKNINIDLIYLREKAFFYDMRSGTELSGNDAMEYFAQIDKNNEPGLDRNNSIVEGLVANMGFATGIVKVVFGRVDFKKINEGDVIVSPMTNVLFVPVLGKVVAIVTDEGGIASHAAIISREMNIPCIVGTKVATRVLHDGDLVEVDADKGVVKILKRK